MQMQMRKKDVRIAKQKFDKDCAVKSPLNYTGGKFKLLNQIVPLLPKKINTFVDLFCGGCNVGINVASNNTLCVDIQESVISLMNMFKRLETEYIIKGIEEIIEKYDLSMTSVHGYKHYDCNSGDGLSKVNKEKFEVLRKEFNECKLKDDYYYLLFYTIIVYGFNNQIRFNSKGEFNIPVGKRDFNNKIKSNLTSFIDRIHSTDIEFINNDFRNLDIDRLTNEDFVYADPPYLITCATYNEQDRWTEKDETDLFCLLDNLNSRNIRFALSNVLKSAGKENHLLRDWSKKYRVRNMKYNYKNSSYQKKDRSQNSTIEVLITNY
ncbi:MAG: DNA adenine methylase [Clostridia bacterium]|nr:DNA adenine methylase [Clostridia bacterium]